MVLAIPVLLLLEFEHLLCPCSRSLGLLSCHALTFFLALRFHDGELLGPLLFNSIDPCLSFPLSGELLFTFGLEQGDLTVVLFLLFLLLLLLEDLLELFDRAAVFVGQLLQLGPVLLLFFTLACLLIFGLLVHDLVHELVSLLGRVIELVLAFFDDLAASLILLMCADGHSGVTSIVTIKDIHSGVFHDIFEH